MTVRACSPCPAATRSSRRASTATRGSNSSSPSPSSTRPARIFLYNPMGAYVLSAIVTRVTGQTSLEFLKPRLFTPLGIQNPRWDASPEGNSLGGYGLYLRAEDIAKFGELCPKKESGTAGSSSPVSGLKRPQPNTSITRRRATPRSAPIGCRATAINSGAAGTTPIAPTEPAADSSSSCPIRTPSSPSPPTPAISRRDEHPSGTTCSRLPIDSAPTQRRRPAHSTTPSQPGRPPKHRRSEPA